LCLFYGALKGEQGLDEVLEMLDKTAKRVQKVFEESKEMASKQTAVYERTLQSKEASEAQKVKAFIGRALELDRLERLSAQLSLLYVLQIFAFKVKVLEIEVDNVNERLARSGVLEKHMEIEGIKKNIDALKILVEAQYESLKDIREKQSKDLQYIF
jgi:archaellum component FlaC